DVSLEMLQLIKPYEPDVKTVAHDLFRKREKYAKVATSIWRSVIKHLYDAQHYPHSSPQRPTVSGLDWSSSPRSHSAADSKGRHLRQDPFGRATAARGRPWAHRRLPLWPVDASAPNKTNPRLRTSGCPIAACDGHDLLDERLLDAAAVIDHV